MTKANLTARQSKKASRPFSLILPTATLLLALVFSPVAVSAQDNSSGATAPTAAATPQASPQSTSSQSKPRRFHRPLRPRARLRHALMQHLKGHKKAPATSGKASSATPPSTQAPTK